MKLNYNSYIVLTQNCNTKLIFDLKSLVYHLKNGKDMTLMLVIMDWSSNYVQCGIG